MATSAEPPIPVWGIEAGNGLLRAVRIVRMSEGGFQVLASEEKEISGHGPEALAAFVRRKGLRDHPLVVAIRSPAPHFATVDLTTEEMLQSRDELRDGFLEQVHPEPEFVDLRYARVGMNVWLLCAEERARVESFLVALETMAAPAYALVASIDGVYGTLRRTGLVKEDVLAVRVEPHWTDLLFLDGDRVRRQGLPLGWKDLDDDDELARFAQDVGKLREYHRSRQAPGGEIPPEKFVLLGVDGPRAGRIADVLPGEALPFPGDAVKIRGKGRITDEQARSLLRTAPGAVGAALAGAVRPHKLDLAFRELPEELSVPKEVVWPWFAAAGLLWAALLLALFGVKAQVSSLEERLARPAAVAAPTAAQRERFDALARIAALNRVFPGVVERVFDSLPGEEVGAFTTTELEITATSAGGYRARLALDGLDPDAREEFLTGVNEEGADWERVGDTGLAATLEEGGDR